MVDLFPEWACWLTTLPWVHAIFILLAKIQSWITCGFYFQRIYHPPWCMWGGCDSKHTSLWCKYTECIRKKLCQSTQESMRTLRIAFWPKGSCQHGQMQLLSNTLLSLRFSNTHIYFKILWILMAFSTHMPSISIMRVWENSDWFLCNSHL